MGVTGEKASISGSCSDPLGTIRADAPAKVNLTLEILGRREDGFHELRSLVIGVGLHDTVSCTLASAGSFTIECSDPTLATPDNLAIRAAKAFAATIPDAPGLAIDLIKRIPAGGGLGGGSSDAAAVLQVFNQLLGCPVSRDTLARVGSQLGSDVPVFFGLPSAVMTGRGETVKTVELAWRGWVLLIGPGIHIATGEVYAACNVSESRKQAEGFEKSILSAKNAREIDQALTNQLEPAVFRVSPALGELVENLFSAGCGDFQVSGSGSTLFRLFDDPGKAGHTAETIAERFSNVTTSVVAAPVGMNPLASEDD